MLHSKDMLFALGCFFAGIAAPAAVPALANPCDTGCALEQTVSGGGCPAVEVTWSFTPGSETGKCVCEELICVQDRQCDLEVTITFSVKIPYAGCVFNRIPGGQWGQTSYTTTIVGCNARGAARQVAWSTTCDPAQPTCITTFLPYCGNCTGRDC